MFRPEDTSALYVDDEGEGGDTLISDVRPFFLPSNTTDSNSVSGISFGAAAGDAGGGSSLNKPSNNKTSSNKPLTEALAGALSRAVVVEQEAGQVLFVPSGWHHQVVLLTPLLFEPFFVCAKHTVLVPS
jgi:hypothetical protein